MSQLSIEKIALNYLEKLPICPALDKASQMDVAAFEEEFTPQDKCRFSGSHSQPAEYDFRSQADEDRACAYGHGHFLLNRYLSALVGHLCLNGIDLKQESDFCQYIWPQADEKMEIILHNQQPLATAAPQPFNMLDYANRLLASPVSGRTKGCR